MLLPLTTKHQIESVACGAWVDNWSSFFYGDSIQRLHTFAINFVCMHAGVNSSSMLHYNDRLNLLQDNISVVGWCSGTMTE